MCALTTWLDIYTWCMSLRELPLYKVTAYSILTTIIVYDNEYTSIIDIYFYEYF